MAPVTFITMYKIISLTLFLFITGCASTDQHLNNELQYKNQKTTKNISLPVKIRGKKLTDSNNKEDDNYFEHIVSKLNNVIVYLQEKLINKRTR